MQKNNWELKIVPRTAIDNKMWFCVQGVKDGQRWFFAKCPTQKKAKTLIAVIDPEKTLRSPW